MNLTELLVTGFDGDHAVLAFCLTPEKVATVMADCETGRVTAFEATAEHAQPAFKSACRLVDGLTANVVLDNQRPR